MVFFVAIASLSLFPSNYIARLNARYSLVVKEPVFIRQTTIILLSIPVLIAFSIAIMKIGLAPLNKVERIAVMGKFHYVLLTLWPVVLFCYMTVSPRSKMNLSEGILFSSVVTVYFAYCLYMEERDFALISLPLLFWYYKDRPVPVFRMFVGVPIAAILFTALSAGRSSEMDGSGLASFLNQGSNLMVTSNILLWIEQEQNLMWGMSYFAGFVNMITLGAVKLVTPLSIWFSQKYSSAVNDGAFGFSIEGEALINFGLIGIPFLFSIIACFLAWTYKGFLKGTPVATLLTYYSLFYFIYAIRGESLILFKAFMYCMVIFILLVMISQRGRLYFAVQHRF
uniref:hypothetical protein n=1 Tax=Ningiella ruwaisensis TaxID=2364274 RepID=UPI00109F0C61|nr:hypothetical protein [Ningiella ruwaisensis]